MDIEENYLNIVNEIKNIEKHSIANESVKLIVVTKTRSIEEIKKIISLGATDIGENKVQELLFKMDKISSKINYHMIGNLQSNKVKYIYDKIKLIQSLDNETLLKEINKRAKTKNIIVNCLVEVNIADEKTKGGLSLEKIESFVEKCIEYKNIKIQGLMTVAPNINDEKFLRNCFKIMFNLKEKIKNKNYSEIDMKYLSMGMSNDYKIAIEEGSNMVRIGTSIFGRRK